MRWIAGVIACSLLLWLAMTIGGTRDRAEVTLSSADVFTLDPQRMTYMQDLRVARALFDGLCNSDPYTATPAPGVADRWEVSPDGRTWKFHIDPRAQWSNGDPITSNDFRESWRRVLLPDTAADYTSLLFPVKGAEEFFKARTEALSTYAAQENHAPGDAQKLWDETKQSFDQLVAVRAPDPATLVVELTDPLPYWLDLCAFPTLAPIHQPTLERFIRFDDATGQISYGTGWTKPGVMVNNGPLKLVEWKYKRFMRFEPNEQYRGPDPATVKSIEIVPIEDANTAVLAYESGTIDWVTDLTAEFRADLAQSARDWAARHKTEFEQLLAKGMTVDEALAALPTPDASLEERRDIHALGAFGTDFWSFNCRPNLVNGKSNPFADARVRRAFARAVDKRALTASVTRLNEPVSNVLVPVGSIAGYESPQGLSFDIAAAKAELAQAGWIDRNADGILENANGEEFPAVDMLYMTGNPRVKNIAIALAAMWRDGLGVQCELRSKDGKFAKEDLKQGNFMIARGGWYGDYQDPTTFLDLSRTGNGNNDRAFSNAKFDGLLDMAAKELNQAKRLELLTQAERLLVEEEMPILPLCQYVTMYMFDPVQIRGVTRNARLSQPLWRIHRVSGAATDDSP